MNFFTGFQTTDDSSSLLFLHEQSQILEDGVVYLFQQEAEVEADHMIFGDAKPVDFLDLQTRVNNTIIRDGSSGDDKKSVGFEAEVAVDISGDTGAGAGGE